LVKFKPAYKGHLSTTKPKEDQTETPLLAAARELGLPPGAMFEEPALGQLLRRGRPLAAADHSVFDRFLYLRFPPGTRLEPFLEQLQRNPWIDYAEPDGVGTGGRVPNDPNFGSQWHHQNAGDPSASIQTPAVWETATGASNTIVAVLDTGLNPALAEFAGRVLPGYNFASNSVDISDDHGHGTAVTGTLAATGDNDYLVAGVDWRCRLLPVKVLGYDNTGQYSWWAQGVDFAVTHGAKIINLSAGGFGTSTTLTRAIENAIAQGVIFITIAHNDGSVLRYPGNLPTCITVGATDSHDRRCGFSNFGPQLDLVAPGTNIFTVSRSGTLQSWWGTSFAAPLTSGVCALLANVRPQLNQQQARTLLLAGAVDRVGGSEDLPGFDPYYGWGRLNALNSLLLAQLRLSSVSETNGVDLHLSWLCPSNAVVKQPFQVERASAPTGPWTIISTGQFLYNGNQCAWIDRGAATNSAQWYYRIGLRSY